MKRALLSFIGIAALTVSTASLAADTAGSATPPAKEGVELHDAWIHEAAAGQSVEAYVMIDNKADKPDELMFITGPDAGHVEIAEDRPADGQSRSTSVGPLAIPAGETTNLELGPMHLKVYDLQQALTRGNSLFLVFHFKRAGDVSAHFVVKRTEQERQNGNGETRGADKSNGSDSDASAVAHLLASGLGKATVSDPQIKLSLPSLPQSS